MRTALSDIQAHLRNRHYRNKHHVQLGVVLRLLHELEWDIWSPREVCPQYAVGTGEHSLRVDLALLIGTGPSMIVKITEVGGLSTQLASAERELGEAARRGKTPLCLITDGCLWRFYLVQRQGTMPDRCFTKLDLLKNPLEDTEEILSALLKKDSLADGVAVAWAEDAFRRVHVNTTLSNCLTTAREMAAQPGHANLVETLMDMAQSLGSTLRQDEVVRFLRAEQEERDHTAKRPTETQIPAKKTEEPARASESVSPPSGVHELNPLGPVDLRYTNIDSAQIGGENVTKWVSLFDTAIRIARDRGMSLRDLERVTTAHFRPEATHDDRYHAVEGTDLAAESLDFSLCCQNTFLVARQLSLEVTVKFHWRDRKGAAHPGEAGIIRWSPKE